MHPEPPATGLHIERAGVERAAGRKPMEKTQDVLAAVRARNLDGLKRLLEADPSLVDARGEDGVQAVLAALYVDARECAELLIARGAALDVFSAAGVGDVATLARRLDEDPRSLNAFASDGWTPLHLAAFFGRPEAARLLLDRGADLHAISKNPTANTPLHAAAVRGHLALVELLAARGAELSRPGGGGWTPLHLAAGSGHEAVVSFLIGRGADLEAREAGGRTPLGVAAGTHHDRIVKLIRAAGGA